MTATTGEQKPSYFQVSGHHTTTETIHELHGYSDDGWILIYASAKKHLGLFSFCFILLCSPEDDFKEFMYTDMCN